MDDTAPTQEPFDDRPTQPGRRRRFLVGGGAAVAVVAVVGIAFAVTSGSTGHTRRAGADPTRSASASGPRTSDHGSGPSARSSKHDTTTSGAGGPGSSTAATGATGTDATGPGATTSPSPSGSTPTTKRGHTTTGSTPGQSPDATDVSPEITAAYVSGYNTECQRLWSQAGPSGKLWDADDLQSPPHLIGECLSQLDSSNAWFFFQDSTADARQGGKEDADSTAESMTLGNRFQTSTGLVVYIP